MSLTLALVSNLIQLSKICVLVLIIKVMGLRHVNSVIILQRSCNARNSVITYDMRLSPVNFQIIVVGNGSVYHNGRSVTRAHAKGKQALLVRERSHNIVARVISQGDFSPFDFVFELC